jgi:hypothetical protein
MSAMPPKAEEIFWPQVCETVAPATIATASRMF